MNLVQKFKFGAKMEILSTNGNFVHKWKFCPKLKILFKNATSNNGYDFLVNLFMLTLTCY